jgi:ATP-dependent DNA ligase
LASAASISSIERPLVSMPSATNAAGASAAQKAGVVQISDGEDIRDLPLVDRKARLEALLVGAPKSLRYNDHQIGQGPAFHRLACQHGLEGIVSKRIDGRYEPGRRTWLKTKCLNREEFVVGWSDPEGGWHRIGALLLGYDIPQGQAGLCGPSRDRHARRRVGAPVVAPSTF